MIKQNAESLATVTHTHTQVDINEEVNKIRKIE